MLVFTRKRGESFFVGNAKISVLKNNGQGMRIGIEAPPDVRVLRSELLERIEAGESISELRDEFDLAENRKRIGA
jgi:carbon storage regulator